MNRKSAKTRRSKENAELVAQYRAALDGFSTLSPVASVEATFSSVQEIATRILCAEISSGTILLTPSRVEAAIAAAFQILNAKES